MIEIAHLQAVTFDFWNTVMYEPPGGLAGARVRAWGPLLAALGCARTDAEILASHDAANSAQQSAWKRNEQYVTDDAADAMAASLGLALTPDALESFERVFELAASDAGVMACDGIEQLLGFLRRESVRLAVVCDIGLTPAEGVRSLLRDAGLLEYFDATVFSDEQGVYKPDVRMFEHALQQLGADPSHSLHVGDRRRTDVEGAIDAGMGAVRYRAVFDDLDTSYRDAPIVIDDHRQLVALGAVR